MSRNTFTQGHLSKIEWLVADVTAVVHIPWQSKTCYFEYVVGCFFGQYRLYVWPGNHFVMCESPFAS